MPTTYPCAWIKAADLQIGDTITIGSENLNKPQGPWLNAIVQQIDNQEVTLFRPYGHADGFKYTGGVICYVGIETFKVRRDSPSEYFVWQRETLK